ncbi:MAG TPA: GyrI-like domain-containing protein [Candidatus Limnocylindrales bacterium]|nr:GyrI-like domain-containing protein [Candidatus Limnocylindrales bacterium]
MTVATRPSIEFETPTDYRDEIRARVDRVRWLIIPDRRYFAIDGTDAPGGPGFRDAIATLYPVAYTTHFALKRRGIDAPVGALQGLFWLGGQTATDELAPAPPPAPGGWRWRLLLPVPDEASPDEIEAAIANVRGKKTPPRIDDLRILPWGEGTVAQIMHVGPYVDEPTTIARLHAAVVEAGLRLRGIHHEIYIGDPSRTAPQRLKTLLRQGVGSGSLETPQGA